MSMEHSWVYAEEGIEVCHRVGCGIRRTTGGGTWQRKKGGHWRIPSEEPPPPCYGKSVASDAPKPTSVDGSAGFALLQETPAVRPVPGFATPATHTVYDEPAIPPKPEGQCEGCDGPEEGPHRFSCSVGGKRQLRFSASLPARPALSPLARVRAAVECLTMNGQYDVDRQRGRDALPALAVLERVFPEAMQAMHWRERAVAQAEHAPATWQDCPDCASLLKPPA